MAELCSKGNKHLQITEAEGRSPVLGYDIARVVDGKAEIETSPAKRCRFRSIKRHWTRWPREAAL